LNWKNTSRTSSASGDVFVNGAGFLLREAADVDHVGGFEGPDESLDPRHDRKKTGPAHEIDGFGVRMFAGDGNAPG
jgi:hypothetical protein